jgi:membrane protease YdiL (CAAX protease family)
MRTLTLRAFVAGPSAWRTQNPWHPLLAVLAAIGVVVAGQLAPVAALVLLRGEAAQGMPSGRPGEDALYQLAEGSGATLLLLSQSMLALSTMVVASLYRHRFPEVLNLVRPDGGGKAYLFALALLVPLLGTINALAYWLSPAGFLSDFQQFASLARTPQPATAFLAIAVGAPLWEEMLFRGFLVGPIAGVIGFWPAAVLVSGAWTALHLGYSPVGLAEVFLIGLYFSWLLWRTGSLWVPIACHAIYNGCLFVAMRYLPV